MKSSLATALLVSSLFGVGRVAEATVISGVDISNPIVFEVPLNGDFSVSTSKDVYVFAPNSIVADVFDSSLNGTFILLAPVTITANDLILNFGSVGPIFDLESDVIVKFVQPIGDLALVAGGSIVLAAQEIPELFGVPEPGTGLLLVLGVTLTAAGWRSRRRPAARLAAV